MFHSVPTYTLLIRTMISLPSMLVTSALVFAPGSNAHSEVVMAKPVQGKSEHFQAKSEPLPTPPAIAVPVDEPVRPQPQTPPGVELVLDAPNNISIYTPAEGFIYNGNQMLNLSAGDIPSWIAYDINNDNEQVGENEESWNSSLYAFYNNKFGQTYQYEPIELHAHWWGEPELSPSHDAIVNYIDNKDALTVNFVVSANRVTSMMPLSWMATTTGYRNPWGWKMEIDPRLTEDVYKTVGALMYLVELKNGQLQNEPIRLHKEFYPTGCADIDGEYLRAWVNNFATGAYDINTGQQAPASPAQPSVPAPASTPTQSIPTTTPSFTP